jgi:hypothetical protein
MELTGQLYGFYSNKNIEVVFDSLEKFSLTINYKYDENTIFGERAMIFFKDEKMWEHHLENGYNTDFEGKGCFSVESKLTRLNGISTLSEFDGNSDFEPIDINLTFTEVYYYVLTVPHFIEDDEFSKNIMNSFREILMRQ